jgi:quinol monooxygenase YgiN
VPLHVFVRFEPLSGKQHQLLDELTLILEPTRAEPGCTRIHLFESTRDPLTFFIHSEWTDEAAFDAHAKVPHMTRFLGLVGELISHPVQALRVKQIG